MKICFWGKISDALNGRTGGGGELQIATIARALCSLGHEVVVVDLDITEEYYTSEGIRVCPVKDYNKGVRILRTWTHRFPGLYSTFRDIGADIYYCRIRDSRHIIMYLAARKVKAKFILSLASDLDILGIGHRWRHFYSSNVRDLWGVFNGITSELDYPFLLRNADLVMVQHMGQQEILRNKGIKSEVFHNFIGTEYINNLKSNPDTDFVYIGSLDKRKGFAEFYELVNKTPEFSYKVIGRIRDKTGNELHERLKSHSNVRLMGQLSHEAALREIANSRALVSTSPMEGFPNVFIEAWACGIPVFSLHVDPGNTIEKKGLGFAANGDMSKLIEAMGNLNDASNFSARSKEYVKSTHELNQERITELNSILTRVKNGQ
jgi:glycosyltransferase involved in cell wall biosynthesis